MGERTGEGVYYHANGDKYVGNFKDGMQDGKGTFTWANGAVYEGDWKTINAKAKVSINGVTGMFTKETGRIIVLTVRAL